MSCPIFLFSCWCLKPLYTTKISPVSMLWQILVSGVSFLLTLLFHALYKFLIFMFDVVLGEAFPQKLFLKDTWYEKDNVIKPRLHKQWLSKWFGSWMKGVKQNYIHCVFQVFLYNFWKNWQNIIRIKKVAIWKLRQVQHFPSKTLLVIVILFHNYTSSILFFQWRRQPDVLYYVFVASLRGMQAAGGMFSGIVAHFFSEGPGTAPQGCSFLPDHQGYAFHLSRGSRGSLPFLFVGLKLSWLGGSSLCLIWLYVIATEVGRFQTTCIAGN